VALACVAAEESAKVKKDVLLGVYPGFGYFPQVVAKSDEKTPVVYTGAYPGAYPTAYSYGAYPYGYNYGAYPYSYNYGAYPYAYNYGAYPYSYGAFPYNFGIVPAAKAEEKPSA
jgi:hypothetical protein